MWPDSPRLIGNPDCVVLRSPDFTTFSDNVRQTDSMTRLRWEPDCTRLVDSGIRLRQIELNSPDCRQIVSARPSSIVAVVVLGRGISRTCIADVFRGSRKCAGIEIGGYA